MEQIEHYDVHYARSQIIEWTKESPLEDVSAEYAYYLADSGRLRWLHREKIMVLIEKFWNEPLVMEKLIFGLRILGYHGRTDSARRNPSDLDLIEFCENDEQKYYIFHIMGAAGILTGQECMRHRSSPCFEELKKATYAPIMTPSQLRDRMIIDSFGLKVSRDERPFSWIDNYSLMDHENVQNVEELAQSLRPISEIVLSGLGDGRYPLELLVQVIRRLTGAVARTLFDNIQKELEFRILDEKCVSKIFAYRVLFIAASFPDDFHFWNHLLPALPNLLQDHLHGDIVLTSLAKCENTLKESQECYTKLIHMWGTHRWVLEKFSHLASDENVKFIFENRYVYLYQTYPELLRKLVTFAASHQKIHLTLMFLVPLCRDDIAARCRMDTPLREKMSYDSDTDILTFAGRQFVYHPGSRMRVIELMDTSISCDVCKTVITCGVNRRKTLNFHQYVCSSCKTEEDEPVTCPVCLEEDPVRPMIKITCRHVMCLSCKNPSIVRCPECRLKIEIKREHNIQQLVNELLDDVDL